MTLNCRIIVNLRKEEYDMYNEMTLDEMLNFLESNGHDTANYDLTIVKFYALQFGYIANETDDEIMFLKDVRG